MASVDAGFSSTARPSLAPENLEQYTWRPLRMLAIYRLVVSVILTFGALSGVETFLLAANQPVLFQQATIGYFLFALVLLIISLQPSYFVLQVCLHTLGDILLLGLLIFAVGLEDNGLGTLMLVAVAGGSIMVGLRLAALFAAVASIVLLFQHFLNHLEFDDPGVGYTQIGLLGIAMFVGAIATSYLAKRARESTALAEERGIDLENLQVLNAHIVKRLHDGAVVVDGDNRVRLINDAAWALMGKPDHAPEPLLASLSPALDQVLEQWRAQPGSLDSAVPVGDGVEVMPRCIPLGNDGAALMFVEDLTELRAQVQQAKLASLGRLSASIAHEIRNPLSAMVHAGQLLEEAELTEADRRLLTIIRKQGQRLNNIIENVQRMSRREQPSRSTFYFKRWMQQFAEELYLQSELQKMVINLEDVPDKLLVDFDPEHLGQVVNNLVRNTAEHGKTAEVPPVVSITAGHDKNGRPWIELRDNGKGIPAKDAEHLFDPFFTTASQGTGLGLYLCRELCESNQARLVLRSIAPVSACFRITFSGPGMEQETQNNN